MKIGVISSQFFKTPAPKYGGLERVVYDVSCGLGAIGNKVVLFAPDGSTAPTNGLHVNTGPSVDTLGVDWVETERVMLKSIEPYYDKFDILWQNNWFGSAYSYKVRKPNLKIAHTHHGGLHYDTWKNPPFKLNLIAISQWMKTVYKSQGFDSQVSYNPVDTSLYRYKETKGDRMLFVGRLDDFKRPHIAIEACKNAGVGLDVVGGSFVSNLPYMEKIKSMCDGEQIKLHLDATQEKKIELYQNAKGVIFPSRMGEPFGLIVPEASSCGTGVIGTRDGAIPETIQDGVNGFVVGNKTGEHNDMNDIISISEKISDMSTLSPSNCRKASERFSVENTARRYEYLFKNVIDGYEW